MRRESAPWIGVVAICAVLCTIADLVILQRRFSMFSVGFLTTYRISDLGIPYFVLGSLLVDGAIAAVLAGPALWLTRRLSPHRRMVAAALLCGAAILTMTIDRFDIAQFVGDTLQYRFAPRSTLDTSLLGIGILAGAALVGFVLAVWIVRFLPQRLLAMLHVGSPRPRRALLEGGILLAASIFFLFITGLLSSGMQLQFQRKTTGGLLLDAGTALTDFDRDGFGLVDKPLDWAPFDSRVHPYAVDWPGNGVDENGIGGDLDAPGVFAFEHYDRAQFQRKPDVLIIVLESFRADNVTADVDGKPVTPVLRRLIQEGAVHGPAYSHNGFTIESLSHLFSGSLTLTVRTSIVDDFNDNGYLTACVSGEDESFGGIAERTGLARAGYYRDARDNRSERTNPFSTPGSLTVPWTVVVRNVNTLLDQQRGNPTPLFAYVNLQDCHYPYTYPKMKRLLIDRPIPRDEISPENVDWTLRTYLNAAANVDMAVGQLLDAWEQARGKRPAYVIISDHGESFFENQVLGHGVKLTPIQTRSVFLADGLPTRYVFPIGLSGVRRLLRDALSGNPTEEDVSTDPEKWIFQYVGSLQRPRVVGGAGGSGGVIYHFGQDRFTFWGEPRRRFADLARFWEQIVLYRAEHPLGRAHPVDEPRRDKSTDDKPK